MSEINVPLLRKTLEYIESHPKTWRQDQFWQETLCGTAFCFAGWALVLSGWDVYKMGTSQVMGSSFISPLDGRPWGGQESARDLLGISQIAAETLFEADNSLEKIREIVNALIRIAENELA